jgi:hypothetical protein
VIERLAVGFETELTDLRQTLMALAQQLIF